MAVLTRIVATASRRNLRPSEVWLDYQEHPRDYHLLWAFWEYEREEEEAQVKKAKAESAPRRLGGN